MVDGVGLGGEQEAFGWSATGSAPREGDGGEARLAGGESQFGAC